MLTIKMGLNSSININTYTMGDQMSHDQNSDQYYNVNAMNLMCVRICLQTISFKMDNLL